MAPNESRTLLGTLSDLPPRLICDFLYRTFLSAVHPLIPLIHQPTFDRYYHRFWNWFDSWNKVDAPSGVLAENPSFLPLVLAVLFTGSVACADLDLEPAFKGLRTRNVRRKLYQMSSDALTLVGFPHSPSTYSLMAFILSQSILIREEESLGSCSFVAVAFRIAQAMGMHKDGTSFNLDPIQVQERRRIWWQLMHLDVMSSIISGLPLIASSDSYNHTQMIGELKDELISKASEKTKDIDPVFDFSPAYILAAGRYDSTSCIRNILHRQFAPQPLDVKSLKESIEALSVRLNERMKILSKIRSNGVQQDFSSLSTDPSSPLSDPDPDSSSDAFGGWSEELLKLMVEKAYCTLYQPLMQDRLWSDLREE